MMKQRHIQVLLGLLVVQAVLCAIVFWPRPAASAAEPLLKGVQSADVAKLTIADASGKSIALQKVDGAWVLPDADNYPVQASTVDAFLKKLAGLTTRRLVARTPSSQQQLKVAADAFVRRLDIELAAGTSYRLYLGTSPTYGTAHMRLDGRDEIYLGEITPGDIQTTAVSWVDPLYLSVPVADVTEILLRNNQGTFRFTKDEQGAWQMAGLLAGETLDQEQVQGLLQQVTALRMLRPLGKEKLPEYGLDTPTAIVTLKTVDKEITLTLGGQDAGDKSYVVSSSESPYFVRVAGANLTNVVEKGHTGFLAPTPTPGTTATPPPGATATPPPGTTAPSTPGATP